MESRKYIFLDVDGVLNCDSTKALSPNGYVGISDKLVKRLKKILDSTNAKIVLSSDWRLSNDDDYKYLAQKLKYKANAEIYSKTPDVSWLRRGYEIRKWLFERNVDNYVILDDIKFYDFNGSLAEHFVLTDPAVGLTDANVEAAIKILNGG